MLEVLQTSFKTRCETIAQPWSVMELFSPTFNGFKLLLFSNELIKTRASAVSIELLLRSSSSSVGSPRPSSVARWSTAFPRILFVPQGQTFHIIIILQRHDKHIQIIVANVVTTEIKCCQSVCCAKYIRKYDRLSISNDVRWQCFNINCSRIRFPKINGAGSSITIRHLSLISHTRRSLMLWLDWIQTQSQSPDVFILWVPETWRTSKVVFCLSM